MELQHTLRYTQNGIELLELNTIKEAGFQQTRRTTFYGWQYKHSCLLYSPAACYIITHCIGLWLGTCIAKLVLKRQLGKEKLSTKYGQVGCLSNKSIFSVSYNTWEALYFRKIMVYWFICIPEGSQRIPTKASKDHSKTHDVVLHTKEVLPRGLETQSVCLCAPDPSEHLLIQQNSYAGISDWLHGCYNSCSSKKALSAHVKLQVTNPHASFSN